MLKKVCVIALMLLSFIGLTGYLGTGVVCAADKKESPVGKAERSKEPERAVDPHVAYDRVYFQDDKMDYVFGSLILGATVNHGCEIGEAFYTAARIKDGDAASWQAEWIKTARLVEARGEKSLAKGHTVSARDQLQRASYYYHAALVSMLSDDPRFRALSRWGVSSSVRTLMSRSRRSWTTPLVGRMSIPGGLPFTDTAAVGGLRRWPP